jgi:alkaline phosphatase D
MCEIIRDPDKLVCYLTRSTMKLSRRDLLKMSGSAAVVLGACGDDRVQGILSGPETIDTSAGNKPLISGDLMKLDESDAFPLGVASGDVTSTSVILWTRYDASENLDVHVWPDGLPSGRVAHTKKSVKPTATLFAHVKFEGLRPGQRYSYAFVAGNVRSSVGSFRCAPEADSLEPVTFVGFTCTHFRREPFPALSLAAEREGVDFWVHGGDKVYCDYLQGVRAAYRDSYERVYRQPGMRAMHRSNATYGVWDDHEFENNFDPETTDPHVIELAKSIYFEHHPFEKRDDQRIWRSFRWGQAAEIFILDCRSERRPSEDLYISREQMDWLKAGLTNSTATFKFIINSVPIADFPLIFGVFANDRWQGYKQQREEILAHITDNGLSDVWWLSGDFHMGAVGRVEKSGPHSHIREVLWGPGANHANPLWRMLDKPQWDFTTGDSNYVLVRADPNTHEVTIEFVNDRNETIFSQTYAS